MTSETDDRSLTITFATSAEAVALKQSEGTLSKLPEVIGRLLLRSNPSVETSIVLFSRLRSCKLLTLPQISRMIENP